MKKYRLLHLFLLIFVLSLVGCKNSDKGYTNNGTINPTIEDTKESSTQASAGNTSMAVTITPTSTPTPSPTTKPTVKPTATPTTKPTQSPTTKPTVAPTTKPTQSVSDKAQNILNNMSLKEKVGQLFFVRCRKDQAVADINKYYLGGYILFGTDFENQSKSSMKKIIKSYQTASEIPLLIGVDEEGGTVNRISKYTAFRSIPFKSPQDLYKKGGYDLIISDTIEKAKLLKSLGINVNLAPVSDVSTNSSDFIYKRSFGKSAKETSKYVTTVVTQMKKQKIGSTLKHFPGYGNNVDTHTGIAIDKRSYSQFEKSDFLPFEAGIKAGADSILVSHNIVTSMDKKYPASLSKKVHRILREDLNFKGVIMTDDLSMDAIKKYTGDEEAAVQAIIAGNDLVIASNFDVQIPAVLSAIKSGKITENRINESVYRVLTWKLSLGLIN
jgi:beta-N-acetylhexosaminidase